MFLLPGTVLDVQDDANGEVFRSVFPERGLIPESVKIALDISHFPELDDRHFALRFTNHGHSFRKFATVDAGHTLLSAIYFLKTAHFLPELAQKQAAQGLSEAFEDRGSECPSIIHKIAHQGLYLYGEKTAGVLGALASPLVNAVKSNPLGAAMTGMSVMGTGSEIANNLSKLKGPQGNMVGA